MAEYDCGCLPPNCGICSECAKAYPWRFDDSIPKPSEIMTADQMPELKECPSCKQKSAALAQEGFLKDYADIYVNCDACGTKSRYCKTAKEAAEAWNTRAIPPKSQEVAEAKDQLWQMAHVQDKQEDESAFMVNWLRGAIKIPQSVKDRIYWSEHATRQHHTPAQAQGEIDEDIAAIIGAFLGRNSIEYDDDMVIDLMENIEEKYTIIKRTE